MTEPFAALEEDFLKVVREVVMCTVTTVDGRGRPRSRILHPVWEIVEGRPVGWIFTTPTPVKSKHLANNPHVSICYAGPLGDLVLGECVAGWVEDSATKKHVYDLINNTPEPVGFDLNLFLIDSPDNPGFHVLRLDPTRIQVNTDFRQTFMPRMAKI